MLALLLAAALTPAGYFEDEITAARAVDPVSELVRVEFRHEGGEIYATGAFWAGGARWRVRFAPPKAGTYRYKWSGVSEQEGTFRARRAAPGVQLARDRRTFVDEKGAPWFWLADTAWNGALLATDAEWETYLKRRKEQRFTAVQFVMTQWRAGRADEDGRVAFRVQDGKLALTPEFFDRMDRRFEELARHGLAAVPVMLWALTSRDKESPGETLSPEMAGLLARYINFRYGAHNVLWFLGGDGDYRGEQAERWRAIARVAFPAGFMKRPVSLHPRGMQDPWPGLKDETWLDYLTYQSGHGTGTAKWKWMALEGPARGWKLEPPRPVIDAEPNYEGHMSYQKKLIDEGDVRRAAYYSLLAGPTAGITYGAHGVWFWSRKREVPLDHANSGEADPWAVCLDYAGAKQMKLMRDLFDRVEWWRLRPDRSLLAEDRTAEDYSDYVAAARQDNGKAALLYLPEARRVVKVSAGWAKAEWLDPRTGRMHAARVQEEMKPPGTGDWLLLLQMAQ